MYLSELILDLNCLIHRIPQYRFVWNVCQFVNKAKKTTSVLEILSTALSVCPRQLAWNNNLVSILTLPCTSRSLCIPKNGTIFKRILRGKTSSL